MYARILKGSQYTLPSPTFVGSDGETPTDCASGPTCTVAREDGTALTAAVVSNLDDFGNYTAAITTTHTSQVDVLTVTWTGTAGSQVQVYTDSIEVVGGHYVTIPELRGEPDLSDTGKYPLSLLREVRDEFEDYVERICGVAFVRRYHRDLIDGNGSSRLILSRIRPRTLLAVKKNGTSQTVTDFTLYPSGAVYWRNGTFSEPDSTNGNLNISVAYEHGYDQPPPRLRREALRVVRSEILSRTSNMSPQVISQTFEGQTIRYSTPDPARGRPTGVLTLDPVLVHLLETVPGIG